MSEIWSRICFINHICFTLCCTSFTECYHCQGHGLSLQADLILSRTSHLPDVFVASFQTCADALCQMNSLANLSKNTSPQWDPSNKENVSQRRGGQNNQVILEKSIHLIFYLRLQIYYTQQCIDGAEHSCSQEKSTTYSNPIFQVDPFWINISIFTGTRAPQDQLQEMLFFIHVGFPLLCAHDLILPVWQRSEAWCCPWREAKSQRGLQEKNLISCAREVVP